MSFTHWHQTPVPMTSYPQYQYMTSTQPQLYTQVPARPATATPVDVLTVNILSTEIVIEGEQTKVSCRVNIAKGDIKIDNYKVNLGIIGPGTHAMEPLVYKQVLSIDRDVLVVAAMMQHNLKLVHTLQEKN